MSKCKWALLKKQQHKARGYLRFVLFKVFTLSRPRNEKLKINKFEPSHVHFLINKFPVNVTHFQLLLMRTLKLFSVFLKKCFSNFIGILKLLNFCFAKYKRKKWKKKKNSLIYWKECWRPRIRKMYFWS